MTDHAKPLVAVSSERKGRIGRELGHASYASRLAESGFTALLGQNGYSTRYVAEPELFKSDAAFSALLGRPSSEIVHLAFRSTEHLRVMSGAYNICYFMWDFDVLKGSGLIQSNIVSDQVHMLNLMDEVWVASEFAREVLARHGVTDAFVVPAPVAANDAPARIPFGQALDRIGSLPAYPFCVATGVPRSTNVACLEELVAPLGSFPFAQAGPDGRPAGRVTLIVADPSDVRENLLNAIDGFHLATRAEPARDTLIVKILGPKRGSFRAERVYDAMSRIADHVINADVPNVLVVPDCLEPSEMDALYSLADFHLSATVSEGANTPLRQAMSFGVVPVSTVHTAMRDDLTDENAIPIRAEGGMPPVEGMAGEIAGRPFTVHHPTRFDVADALARAFALGADERRRMGDRARGDILGRYGAEPTMRRLRERLDHAAARSAA